MDESRTLMHMLVALNVDAELLAKAARVTGVKDKTALVRRGLES